MIRIVFLTKDILCFKASQLISDYVWEGARALSVVISGSQLPQRLGLV
jgi:hypothetical protein